MAHDWRAGASFDGPEVGATEASLEVALQRRAEPSWSLHATMTVMARLARRIHIAGSASKQCAPEKLRYAHELVRGFTHAHSLTGGSLLVQVADEPVSDSDRTLAIIWDWTVIDELDALVAAGKVGPRGATGAVLAVAASQNGLDRIPDVRQEAWNRLLTAGAVQLEVLPADWRSGALIRERQVRHGDVLVTLSGGMGVEHLADLYAARSKPGLTFGVLV